MYGRLCGEKALASEEARTRLKDPSLRDYLRLQSLICKTGSASPFSVVVNPKEATDAKLVNMPGRFLCKPGEWAHCNAMPY